MLRILTRFFRSCRGLAAVEFALIAPVMIATFFGALEVTKAIDVRSRVNDVTSTTADLVAQATTVSSTDITNVFGAASDILYPYDTSSVKIVVSSLVDNGAGGVKVVWSNAQNATARTVGSTVSIPSGLVTSGSGAGLVLAEVTYIYTSPSLVFLTGPLTMTNTYYAKPRRSLTVAHS